MGLIQRCKRQWALTKQLHQMFKAEWEQAKRWQAVTLETAAELTDEELLDCVTSRLPKVETAEELSALSGPTQVIYTLYWYDLEVQNGGLCQYFVNSSRMTAPYLSEALAAVGAEGYRQEFEAFVQTNGIEVTDLSGFAIADAKEFAERNARFPFDAFDDGYYARYEREPLNGKMTAYIRQHLAAFFED